MLREVFPLKRAILFFILLNIGLLILFLLSRNQGPALPKKKSKTINTKDRAGAEEGMRLDGLKGGEGLDGIRIKLRDVRIPVLEYIPELDKYIKTSEFMGDTSLQQKDGSFLITNPVIIFYQKPSLKTANSQKEGTPGKKDSVPEGPSYTRITAREGVLYPKDAGDPGKIDCIRFQKDVQVRGTDPNRPFLFRVHSLTCDVGKEGQSGELITSEEAFLLQSKGLQIRGVGFEASNELKRIKILKKVSLNMEGWSGFLSTQNEGGKKKKEGILSVQCKGFLLIEDFEGKSLDTGAISIESCKVNFYHKVQATFTEQDEERGPLTTSLFADDLLLTINGKENAPPRVTSCLAKGNVSLTNPEYTAKAEALSFREITPEAQELTFTGNPSFSIESEDLPLTGSCGKEIQILIGKMAAGEGGTERITLKEDAVIFLPAQESRLSGENLSILLTDAGQNPGQGLKKKGLKSVKGGGGISFEGRLGLLEGDSFTYHSLCDDRGKELSKEILVRGNPRLHHVLGKGEGSPASLVPGKTNPKAINDEDLLEKEIRIQSREKALFNIFSHGQERSTATFFEDAVLSYEEGGVEKMTTRGDVLCFFFEEPRLDPPLPKKLPPFEFTEMQGEGDVHIQTPHAILWGDQFRLVSSQEKALLSGAPCRLSRLDPEGNPIFEIEGHSMQFDGKRNNFSVMENVKGFFSGAFPSPFPSGEKEKTNEKPKRDWSLSCPSLQGALVKDKQGGSSLPSFTLLDVWAEQEVQILSSEEETILADRFYYNFLEERGFFRDNVRFSRPTALGEGYENTMTTEEFLFQQPEPGQPKDAYRAECPRGGTIISYTQGQNDFLDLSQEKKEPGAAKTQIVGKKRIFFRDEKLVFEDADFTRTPVKRAGEAERMRLLADRFTFFQEKSAEGEEESSSVKDIFRRAEAEGSVKLLGKDLEGYGHQLLWIKDEEKLSFVGKGNTKAVLRTRGLSQSGEVIDYFYREDAKIRVRVYRLEAWYEGQKKRAEKSGTRKR